MLEMCIVIALLCLSGMLISIGRYFTWKTNGRIGSFVTIWDILYKLMETKKEKKEDVK
jgi:hypothetical protein